MPAMEKQTQTHVYPANKQIVIDNTKDYVGRLLQDGSHSVIVLDVEVSGFSLGVSQKWLLIKLQTYYAKKY